MFLSFFPWNDSPSDMEVLGVNEVKKVESPKMSAAAFVQGGIQDSCDDACSICLEPFVESNPSTETSCKHEFHLQCILEWCDRSSNCPMCWQTISMKDPTSQELLAAIEQERNLRLAPRNAPVIHHPTLGDIELQHIPVGMNVHELEERIIRHWAAVGGTRHIRRREGSSGHGLSQLVVLSTHHNAPSSSSISATHQGRVNDNRNYASQSSVRSEDEAGPSEFQSFSDTWRSRFNAISMKYKESISKNTRGWKEKLFSRSPSMADIGSEVRREVNAGIATVSRMMERLEARDSNRPRDLADSSVTEESSRGNVNHSNSTIAADEVSN